MKKYLILFLLCIVISSVWLSAQVTNTDPSLDVSLYWKKYGKQETKITSEKGDLFLKLGHHGPALENLYTAYRVYFNDLGAIDVYSKFVPRLELQETKWYASKSQKQANYGSDNFSVGKTVGLGGVKLWDGEKVITLGPVSKRTAEVELNDSIAQIRMLSYGVPYQGQSLDILFSVSCLEDKRYAIVEVSELNGIPVRFATGVPAYANLSFEKTEYSVMTWGDYKSHEKDAVFNLGVALIYNPNDFEDVSNSANEYLLISKPTSYLKYIITSANDKENSPVNNFGSFKNYVKELQENLAD